MSRTLRLRNPQTALFALVICLHVVTLWTALSKKSYLTDDSIQYLTLSENLSEQGVFSQSYQVPFIPDVQRSPGYPVFLLLLGNSPLLILLIQHLLVLLSGWILYKILRGYFSKTSVWGSLIWLLQPYPILFASLVLSEILFIFLLLLAAKGYLRYFSGGKAGPLALSFIFLALATYVRPLALPLFAVAVAPLLWRLFKSLKSFDFRIAASLLIFPSLIAPWMLRNSSITGSAAFSSMGPMTMVHGRMGGLESMRQSLPALEDSWFMTGDSIAALETTLPGLRWYYSESQSHETEMYVPGVSFISLRFFLTHPLDALVFELRSLGQMLAGAGKGWAQKIYRNDSVAWAFAGLQFLLNLGMFGSFVLALFRFRKWNHPRAAGGTSSLLRISGLCIVSTLLISASVWADGRYRMVVDPFFVVFVVWVWENLSPRGSEIE